MIKVHDQGQSGDEVDGARKLAGMIADSWPWAAKDPGARIDIIPKVQCHGQKRKDLDLVVLMRLPPQVSDGPKTKDVKYVQSLPTDEGAAGSAWKPADVWVRSLCLVIELKGHPAQAVRFVGKRALVRYAHAGEVTWDSASDQNEEQKYSLKGYLEQHHYPVPWIINLIWFTGLTNSDLPGRPHNMLGRNSSWDLFLNVIGQQRAFRPRDGRRVIDACSGASDADAAGIVDLLTQSMQPTPLDRHRMDLLTRSEVKEDWLDRVGRQELIFRGRGGAGKTMVMLQLAYRLCTRDGARILLLTYNRALVADLRRLLDLIGLSDDIARGSIRPQTIHSFLGDLFRAMELVPAGASWLERADDLKLTALEYARGGALSLKDVGRDSGQKFTWHYIFIDEAQDWPDEERDLLRCFYPAGCFVVADGVDQFVRQDGATDWTAGLERGQWQRVPLIKSLRMKAGLAGFVNSFAREMRLPNWEVQESPEAAGGRVIIVQGNYFADPSLHQQLMADAALAKNEPVDLLVCVPPSLVVTGQDGEAACKLAPEFLALGHRIWDGVSEQVRGGYPQYVDQLRIVQYDSCRGLEGWTVLNFGFDDFFDFKRSVYARATPSEEADGPADSAADADRFAVRWLMIPLTRAIDTLVLQISGRPSPVRDALAKVAAQAPDQVEWHVIAGRAGSEPEASRQDNTTRRCV